MMETIGRLLCSSLGVQLGINQYLEHFTNSDITLLSEQLSWILLIDKQDLKS